jgi:hypothetical protein
MSRRGRGLLVCLALLGGCDWQQYAFLNSLPVAVDPDSFPVMHVFLGLDGVSYETASEALAHDADFRSGDWHLAPSISMFPATSDASWSRIMHTPRVEGYEYESYDPDEDEIHHGGLTGLLSHGIPAFEDFGLHEPPYYGAFDFYANGYFDTLAAYQETDIAYASSMDSIFFLLGSRAGFVPAFSAYLLELDVMGHMQTHDEVVAGLKKLWRRIHEFKRNHPERTFVFTLLSDHGMDFIPAESKHLLDFDDELRDLDITPVKHLADGRDKGGLYALPIIHTRVSYLALHTDAPIAQEVARRCSTHHGVDLVISAADPDDGLDPEHTLRWTALWDDGSQLLRFAHDAGSDTYYLPRDADYARLELAPVLGPEAYTAFTDEDLFAATATTEYPDLFYRARTSLAAVGVKYPAQVLISFRRPYASAGFKLPGGANEIASEGFHGALDAKSSNGILLTEERELPAFVRSENVLRLLPSLRRHLEHDLDQDLRAGDSNAALDE